MGKYDSIFGIGDDEIVNIISQKMSGAVNRSERRKILKSLNKTKNIAEYTQKRLNDKVNKQLEISSNETFGYIMSMTGIILHDKYNWSDDDIGDFFTEVSKQLNGEWADGKSVEDVAAELLDKTGIELRVK